MAISRKIKEYLNEENINFDILEHPVAYTALEIADAQHLPGKQLAKSVIVRADDDFIMCVLPAIHLIDFEKLKKVSGRTSVALAEEDDVAILFPEYEIGAEPPFGHLYGLTVYADKTLENDDTIAFNAGTHTDVIKIKLSDFKRLVNPIFAEIGTHR